ncbi:hypothetical protein [Legionella sp. W10-070]|uniref:hypothetical protein n=1 Tax=Legionella sp. W10-070 TaxID=1117709 RepID=UPI001054CBF8|nr:hypothetical protein [Legionella sp. W10-070]
MKRKIIFATAMQLIDSLEILKAQIAGKKEPEESLLAYVSDLFIDLQKNLSSVASPPLDLEASTQLMTFSEKMKTLLSEQTIEQAVGNIKKILGSLKLEVPDMLFLLTAPFDEEAKTGDGQYAKSLVEGFSQYGSQTECIWLKQKDKHYNLVAPEGVKPIPADTVPSVYVLQPVANGQTVISGYQYLTKEARKIAEERIKGNVTLRTPQVIQDARGNLELIAYRNTNEITRILEEKDIQAHIDAVVKQREEAETEYSVADKELSDLSETKVIYNKLSLWKSKLARLLNEKERDTQKISSTLKKLNQCLSTNGIAEPVAYQDFINHRAPLQLLIKIIKPGEDLLKGTEQKLLQAKEKLKAFDLALELLNNLKQQFEPSSYDEEKLISIINQLSGISDSYYDIENQAVGKFTARKPATAQQFYKVLEIARQDPDRKIIIAQLIQTMSDLGKDKQCGIDIHIRPPDTGAFIMPEDIVLFKENGLTVNITVHEYKQNYTRPHLQKMTHDLLREADTVLFFNEKDKNNAVKASLCGDLDHSRKSERNWPIETYDLQSKAGLTVASQVLSGKPMRPELIIQKEPNILSFGTIRPGKGFEEALSIAKAIKVQEQSIKKTLTHPPKVLVAGDPQYNELMQQLFIERYGKELVSGYQQLSPCSFLSQQSKEKRQYWQTAKRVLEEKIKQEGLELNNPYLEIYPWCEPSELAELKNRSKYVCRMDDMGMRNNGSAIISVLDVGVVYTKWGCVTGKEYYPVETSKYPKGSHGDAVDLGEKKYGLHHGKKIWNSKEKIESDYKRRGLARDPVKDILTSILGRELDQQSHADTPAASKNYQTVVAAQQLLTARFTLQNGVRNLQQAFIQAVETHKVLSPHPEEAVLEKSSNVEDEGTMIAPEETAAEKVIVKEERKKSSTERYKNLGAYAKKMMFLAHQENSELLKKTLVKHANEEEKQQSTSESTIKKPILIEGP